MDALKAENNDLRKKYESLQAQIQTKAEKIKGERERQFFKIENLTIKIQDKISKSYK